MIVDLNLSGIPGALDRNSYSVLLQWGIERAANGDPIEAKKLFFAGIFKIRNLAKNRVYDASPRDSKEGDFAAKLRYANFILRFGYEATPQHRSEMMSWLLEAATKNREAQYSLAQIYNLHEPTVATDEYIDLCGHESKAAEYYIKSAKQQYGPANLMCGVWCEQNGDEEGARQFFHDAQRYLRCEAEKFRLPESQYVLGNCYREGIGDFEPNPKKGNKWLAHAAMAGFPPAVDLFGKDLIGIIEEIHADMAKSPPAVDLFGKDLIGIIEGMIEKQSDLKKKQSDPKEKQSDSTNKQSPVRPSAEIVPFPTRPRPRYVSVVEDLFGLGTSGVSKK